MSSRPAFVDDANRAYAHRRKNVLLLTGNVRDVYWSSKLSGFIPLEQLLFQELSAQFTVIRMDAATGISCFQTPDEKEIQRVTALWDSTNPKERRLGDIKSLMLSIQHEPLPSLVLLRDLAQAYHVLSKSKEAGPKKPLCAIIQFSGSVFPAGDFDRLSELDRQRLVTFLSWASSPQFTEGENLVILISDTRAEVNARIIGLPTAQAISLPLPAQADRRIFVDAHKEGLTFTQGIDDFVDSSAGLSLTRIQDLLEVARRTKEEVGRKQVISEVNTVLDNELGEIIKIKRPGHGIKDIIANEAIIEILSQVFRRADNPETAFSAMIVSGANGVGKTFLLEAFAGESGRVYIELAGLRSQWFGQTDKLFEMLRYYVETFGKIFIGVDEAHTAFGSVHDGGTHETEKRLAGNVIKMMGDRSLRGKVLWGLMTSRPDELDPDVKRRAPIQIPIFNFEGDERIRFVKELFARKKLILDEESVQKVIAQTEHYYPSDFSSLLDETVAAEKPVLEVLDYWQASSSIIRERKLQELIALQHCSYRKLVPKRMQDLKPEDVIRQIRELSFELADLI